MALPVYLGGVPRRHIFEPLKIDQLRMLAMTQLMEEKASKAVIAGLGLRFFKNIGIRIGLDFSKI